MLGVLGSLFGVLGIFTVGIIFVPLGLLCTLFSFFKGDVLLGLVSFAVNVFAIYTSPTLLLVISGFINNPSIDPPVADGHQISIVKDSKIDYFFDYPADEKVFIEKINARVSELYKSSKNDNPLMQDDVKNKKVKLLKSYVVNDWIGTVENIDKSYEGTSAVLVVKISPTIILNTSYIENADDNKTLIPKNSALGMKVKVLKIGHKIKFSGRFFPNTESSGGKEVGLYGYTSSKETRLWFRFSKIDALQ